MMTYQNQQQLLCFSSPSVLTLSLYWFCVDFSEPPHIRSTLYLNVGTCETLVEPSVTLQMALLVKVGHGRTLSSTEGRTMEITGVWSLGLNTVWGLQDMGRGTLPWSVNHTTVVLSTTRYYKTLRLCQAWTKSFILSLRATEIYLQNTHKLFWVSEAELKSLVLIVPL